MKWEQGVSMEIVPAIVVLQTGTVWKLKPRKSDCDDHIHAVLAST